MPDYIMRCRSETPLSQEDQQKIVELLTEECREKYCHVERLNKRKKAENAYA